jgi:DNA-nicking Smr family endonuclease
LKSKTNPPHTPKKSSLSFDDSTTESNWMDQIFTSIGEIPDKEEDSDPSLLPDQKSKPAKIKTSRKAFQSHTAPDETLDLHGKTRQEALMLVENYVHYGALHGLDSLLIVTGKGNRSQAGPVLKQTVEQWLIKNGGKYIAQVREAPPRWGGSGALWVIFRR